jgi:hypothetical protein
MAVKRGSQHSKQQMQVDKHAKCSTTKGKVNCCMTSFSIRHQPTMESIPTTNTQRPRIDFEKISDEQIARKARSLNAYKAPGVNGISNVVLTHCTDLLAPHLGPIFRATF